MNNKLQANLKIAKKIKPTYNQTFCGCGEGWEDERCQKLTHLMNDGEPYCIFDKKRI